MGLDQFPVAVSIPVCCQKLDVAVAVAVNVIEQRYQPFPAAEILEDDTTAVPAPVLFPDTAPVARLKETPKSTAPSKQSIHKIERSACFA
jgi:hypothetical protein